SLWNWRGSRGRRLFGNREIREALAAPEVPFPHGRPGLAGDGLEGFDGGLDDLFQAGFLLRLLPDPLLVPIPPSVIALLPFLKVLKQIIQRRERILRPDRGRRGYGRFRRPNLRASETPMDGGQRGFVLQRSEGREDGLLEVEILGIRGQCAEQ